MTLKMPVSSPRFPTLALALAAIAGAWVTSASPAQAGLLDRQFTVMQRTTIKQDQWRLDLARNPFSEQLVCHLSARNGRAFYQAGAVAFHFNSRWNTSAAAYRLDNGPPRLMRDDLPELIGLKAPIDRGGLENATQGLVWVPFRLIAPAQAIAIAPTAIHAPRRFPLAGLVALRALAATRGCTTESAFVGL
jgi:hypothetical protein